MRRFMIALWTIAASLSLAAAMATDNWGKAVALFSAWCLFVWLATNEWANHESF